MIINRFHSGIINKKPIYGSVSEFPSSIENYPGVFDGVLIAKPYQGSEIDSKIPELPPEVQIANRIPKPGQKLEFKEYNPAVTLNTTTSWQRQPDGITLTRSISPAYYYSTDRTLKDSRQAYTEMELSLDKHGFVNYEHGQGLSEFEANIQETRDLSAKYADRTGLDQFAINTKTFFKKQLIV